MRSVPFKAMLLEDHITALLYEERFYQGYYPVKLLYEYLVQGTLPTEKYIYTNINVVLKAMCIISTITIMEEAIGKDQSFLLE